MNYVKQRIAGYMCLLILFTTVFCGVPQENVQASGNKKKELRWADGYDKEYIGRIEKGTSGFYLGDYIEYGVEYDEYNLTYLGISNVTYASSNTKVISINRSTGKANAKKTGKSVITVKYKGKSLKRTFEVVKSIKTEHSGFEENEKIARKFNETYGNGITSKNRYKLLSLANAIGKNYGNRTHARYFECLKNNVIQYYAPELQHYNNLYTKIYTYADSKNPFSTRMGKYLKTKSLAAKNNTITITLSGKINSDHLFGIKGDGDELYYYNGSTKVVESNTATWPVYIRDIKTFYVYKGMATVKKGSNKVVINTGNLHMKKGNKYSFMSSEDLGRLWNWLRKGSPFKAK